VDIAAGDLTAAEEWADRHVTVDDDVSFLREYEHLTLVRLLLARHHRAADDPAPRADPADGPAALGEVLALLDRLHADADRRRDGSLLEIGMLRALTLQARGHRLEALAELDRALAAAPEPDGYARLFLDEGAPMLALLHDAAHGPDGEHDVLRQHARRLLRTAPPPPDRGSRDGPLSERELEVLRLLDSELTGPEIARHLFVSLNTLRTHTKRIFTKLDVNTRAAATRRGRELGLL
jgi:LuxR family maltose regulon positive regulatory protein